MPSIEDIQLTTNEMVRSYNTIQTESIKIDDAIENIAAVTEQSAASSQELAATMEEVASLFQRKRFNFLNQLSY